MNFLGWDQHAQAQYNYMLGRANDMMDPNSQYNAQNFRRFQNLASQSAMSQDTGMSLLSAAGFGGGGFGAIAGQQARAQQARAREGALNAWGQNQQGNMQLGMNMLGQAGNFMNDQYKLQQEQEQIDDKPSFWESLGGGLLGMAGQVFAPGLVNMANKWMGV